MSADAKRGVAIWGLQPDANIRTWWGARAIWEGGSIDVVFDRQGCYSRADKEVRDATKEEREDLDEVCAWLNMKGMKLMEHKLHDLMVYPQDAELVEVEDELAGKNFVLRANPLRSYGYLYLAAYKKEDPKA